MNSRISTVLLTATIWVFLPAALLADSLEYQNRGNRHEGVKPKPVSGYDIELISVLADYQESVPVLPNEIRLKFFLHQIAPVFLSVRELDYKYYYWMDKVQPKKSWEQGFGNEFVWQTETVLRQLDKTMKLYDLGVLARVERPEPSANELVAPVILYHKKLPKTITGYLFTLKVNGDARLSCSFYRGDSQNPLIEQNFPRKVAGRPFMVRWDAATVAEGDYKMVVKGFFLDTNEPFSQTVRFYHQPSVR
jgi:hypothetical protein